jgi:poly(hydroxyalkanoate) polymerase-like protein
MTAQETAWQPAETAWQAAESAAAALAPDADVSGSVDGAGLGQATLSVLWRAARQPTATTAATMRFWSGVAMAGPVAAARWMGMNVAPPVEVPEGDKRFADRTWSDNPAFFALRQGYLAASRLAGELLDAGSGDAMDDAKARLATGFLLDALAPTNFLLTNPAALKRALETGGGQRARRDRAHDRRRAQQQRAPAPGRHPAVHGGEEPGGDPGPGRVQERPWWARSTITSCRGTGPTRPSRSWAARSTTC